MRRGDPIAWAGNKTSGLNSRECYFLYMIYKAFIFLQSHPNTLFCSHEGNAPLPLITYRTVKSENACGYRSRAGGQTTGPTLCKSPLSCLITSPEQIYRVPHYQVVNPGYLQGR